MVQNMKGTGKIIKHMVREHFSILAEIGMKANGKEIRLTAMENIVTVTDLHMKETGRMICPMDKELNIGMIIQDMKVIIIKVKNMGK